MWLVSFWLAPLKLRPYGAIQMCILLLLLLCGLSNGTIASDLAGQFSCVKLF